jgi:hypothetical protein
MGISKPDYESDHYIEEDTVKIFNMHLPVSLPNSKGSLQNEYPALDTYF